MATSSESVFNNYVKEGSKLSSMKNFFTFFEGLYNGIKGAYNTIMGFINDPFGAIGLTDILNDLQSSSYISDWLSDLGLTDQGLGLVNKYTGGLLSTMDGALGDALGTAMAGAKSYFDSALADVVSKVYIPEEVFLTTVKGLYKIGADQNYGSTLLTLCLEHDLPKTLEWLDDVNSSTYTINDSNLNSRALTAAENGSFHVVKYIMKQMGTAYNQAKNQPAFTEKEVKALTEIKQQYEEWFVTAFKAVFVNSYGNFTVDEMTSFFNLGHGCPEIKISSIGTSDKDFFAKFALTASDVDTIAPIVTVNYDYGWGTVPKEYILPKNREIKKLYVYAVNGVPNNPLESKLLHDRLTYPLYDMNIAALDKMSNAFADSGVGRWLRNARNERDKAIHTLCGKMEKLLFDPARQQLLAYYDKTTIPDFVSTSSSYKASDSQDVNAPIPSMMANAGITYDDFEILELTDDVTNEYIRDKVLSIMKAKPSITKGTTREFTFVTMGENGAVTKKKIFYIFFGDNISELAEDTLNSILLYVISKYLIDKYVILEGSCTIEELMAMYPALISILTYFKSYSDTSVAVKNAANQEGDGNDPVIGDVTSGNVNFEKVTFYESVIDSNGNTFSINDTGVVEVTPSGEVSTFFTPPVPAIGVSIDSADNVVIATYDGTDTVIHSQNPIGDFIIVGSVKGDSPKVVAGAGVGSVKSLIYYGAIYFGGVYYMIDRESNPNKIIVSDDLENKHVLKEVDVLAALGLPSNLKIIGISIMPDGHFYFIIGDSIYKIKFDESYGIASYSKIDIDFDVSNGLTIKTDRIGTVATSVTVNYGTVYDIDIDDPATIRAIVSFYKRVRPAMWTLKYDDAGELVITRTETEYKQSKLFEKYSNPDDPSYRESVDYYGMVNTDVSSSGYVPSKLFESYIANPPKGEDDVAVSEDEGGNNG